MEKLFEIKEDIDLSDLQKLQPAIWIIFTGALLYCKRHGITCRITSIISDRTSREVKEKQTGVHPSGRGIDISIRAEDGWTDLHISRCVHSLCQDYEELGALSYSDLSSRPAVRKSDHIHLQSRPNADISKFIKE